jgi:amidophosphoribosyltransferase
VNMEPFIWDRCGVVAARVWDGGRLFDYIYEGLCAVQHRGQESVGVSFLSEGQDIRTLKLKGLVSQLINHRGDISGFAGIGHNRYSTRGRADGEEFIQPVEVSVGGERLSLAFNGDVANFNELRELVRKEMDVEVRTDAELLAYLLARKLNVAGVFGGYEELASLVKGAYSAVVLYSGEEPGVVAFRDPYGFKPLALGYNEDGFFVSSESVAFSDCYMRAEFVREVRPGEVVAIGPSGMHSKQVVSARRHAHCMFEYVYFARPDSVFEGRSVYDVRERLGRVLGESFPVDADIVIPVPDSGRSAATGFSLATGIPVKEGFQKDRYLYRRSFILDRHKDRQDAVRKKLNPLGVVVTGKRVVVVDDSIVRGASVRRYISDLKRVGAKEIHVRISCPPLLDRCPYGIDFYREELIARKYLGLSHEEICNKVAEELGADSLKYNTIDNLTSAIGMNENELCLGCLTCKYVHDIPVESKRDKKSLGATLQRTNGL